MGEDTVLSEWLICLLPDNIKVCLEEIFQSFKALFLRWLVSFISKEGNAASWYGIQAHQVLNSNNFLCTLLKACLETHLPPAPFPA